MLGFSVKDHQNDLTWNEKKTQDFKSSKKAYFDVKEKTANQKRWKKDTSCSNKNSSTLSLHIAAYENSIESASNGCEDLPKKSKTFKSVVSSFHGNNSFEFPRQFEDNESLKPEVQVFKASQKLSSPNQGSPSSKDETKNASSIHNPSMEIDSDDNQNEALQNSSSTRSIVGAVSNALSLAWFNNTVSIKEQNSIDFNSKGQNGDDTAFTTAPATQPKLEDVADVTATGPKLEELLKSPETKFDQKLEVKPSDLSLNLTRKRLSSTPIGFEPLMKKSQKAEHTNVLHFIENNHKLPEEICLKLVGKYRFYESKQVFNCTLVDHNGFLMEAVCFGSEAKLLAEKFEYYPDGAFLLFKGGFYIKLSDKFFLPLHIQHKLYLSSKTVIAHLDKISISNPDMKYPLIQCINDLRNNIFYHSNPVNMEHRFELEILSIPFSMGQYLICLAGHYKYKCVLKISSNAAFASSVKFGSTVETNSFAASFCNQITNSLISRLFLNDPDAIPEYLLLLYVGEKQGLTVKDEPAEWLVNDLKDVEFVVPRILFNCKAAK